jgi:hypothetical protein
MAKTLTPTNTNFVMVFNDSTANQTFGLTVVEALTKIGSQPIGAALLQAIANAPVAADPAGNFKVKVIRPDTHATIGQPGMEGGSRAVAFNEADGRQGGAGSRAACYWNPNIYNTPNGSRPAFIGLAHELIHCYHYVNGLAKGSYDDEERFTVGLGPYMLAPITENRIRLEHDVPIRHQY